MKYWLNMGKAESAKWRACVLYVLGVLKYLACSSALHTRVLEVLYMLSCLVCLGVLLLSFLTCLTCFIKWRA